ncbi:YjbH domain-containing protein [Alkalimonas sp.]|uniref:YjbH domain-containing protein n=1 Tax=Alkalimonas sp. TaxID=1872453 RepID=UPI00263AC3FD|nr:YjbH domain-containing protein [Alkalimonas sp.]MCC5824639.1 YjbH domain-containing protein [Alkalimonas sp.]
MSLVVKKQRPFFRLSLITLALGITAPPSFALQGFPTKAEPLHYSQGSHGGVGLIQVPTARMAEEGRLVLGYSDNEEYRFWTASLTLFPWMETTIRYADIRNRLYSPFPGFSGDQTYKDKGIDAKFRLLQESYWLPELSIGFRDFGGTGTFESEFIAASKRVGPLDLHLGMGWGYLGAAGNTRNPFCDLRDSFCQRPTGFSGQGGKIDYQQFFKGPASLFGGVEYQTPWQPLRLKLEYEGNDYSRDRAGIEIVQRSRWNAGATYQWGNFDLSASYQRGNTFAFGVHYTFDLHSISQIKLDPPPREVPEHLTLTSEQIARQQLASMLRTEAGFVLRSIELTDDEVVVIGNQLAYRNQDVAIERIGRVLATELPRSVKQYRIVDLEGNRPMVETVIDASDFIAAVTYQSLQSDVTSSYRRIEPESVTSWLERSQFRGHYYGAEAFWIQSFGSPETFFMYQTGLLATAGYQFGSGLALNSTAKLTVFENFDKFNFTVDSQDTPLPRVRTYVREYVTRNKLTMENLYASWQGNPAENWYVQSYAGYLESMFGGVGAEVLYRPIDSNVAVGFDINWVRQRSFENDFDFMGYHVVTGHANIYWQPELLDDVLLTFNIGRFLAGDDGVKIDFAKRFHSGVVVGAHAAFTNVSSKDYGEGSFTKGFYISIPFDLFTLRSARGKGMIPWVPIARDGGQPLIRPVNLIDTTERRSRFGG